MQIGAPRARGKSSLCSMQTPRLPKAGCIRQWFSESTWWKIWKSANCKQLGHPGNAASFMTTWLDAACMVHQRPSPEDGAAAMCMLEPMPERNLYVANSMRTASIGHIQQYVFSSSWAFMNHKKSLKKSLILFKVFELTRASRRSSWMESSWMEM